MSYFKNNKTNILITFSVIGSFGVGWFWGEIFNDETSIERYQVEQKTTKDKLEKNLKKMEYIYEYVNKHHIDKDKIDKQNMWDNAYQGLLQGVDGGLTQYIHPAKEQQVQEQIEGVYVGFGLMIDKSKKGNVYIRNLDENSEAFNQGLANGDIIISINDIDISTLELNKITEIMNKENKIHITVQRDEAVIETTLEKEIITPPDLVHYREIDKDTHYIKIDSFNDKTVEDFEKLVSKEIDNQGKSIIFDVRENYGGTLESYEKIIGLFVEKDVNLYSKRSLNKTEEIKNSINKKYHYDNYVVLVNQNTASAAELFASNVQELLNGKVIGTKTYGKGSIQTVIDLKDGSYMYITDKEYLTSKGKKVNGIGLKPDIEIADYAKQEEKAIELVK